MRRVVWGIVVAVVATLLVPSGPAHGAVVRRQTNVPILWVHGLQSQGTCPSMNSASEAAPFTTVLARHGYAGPVVPIDYYCGDTTGVSIRGAGGPSTTQYPQNGYTQDTPIERLGLDLAWFIYNTYSSKGQPVSLAAASMGGLISTYALTHAGTPGFPPQLLVQDLVTFSTPFGGADKPPLGLSPQQYITLVLGCGSKVQCNQMLPGSQFLTDLRARRIPRGTDATTFGGGPRDIVSFASSSAVCAKHKVNYYAWLPMAYDHAGYLTDTSPALDMPAQVKDRGTPAVQLTAQPHSLEWGYLALTSTSR